MADHALATITNPGSALTDFTLLVDLSRMPASWWTAVGSETDGTKGRVYKSDGSTRLACDWIDFDSTGDTGWLRVLYAGTLAASGTQQLWIEPPVSGNASVAAGDTYGQYAAYDANWEAYVPDGGGNDRTSHTLSATGHGSVSAGGASGKVGTGTDYNGSTQYVDYGDPAGLHALTALSVSAWVNVGSAASRSDIVSKWAAIDNGVFNLLQGVTANTFSIYVDYENPAYPHADDSSTLSTSTDYHLVGTWASGDYVRLYRGGSQVGISGGTHTDTLDSGSAELRIGGADEGGSPDNPFDGVIDEVQIHSAQRSSYWIAEEYAQSNDNATFWGTWSWVTAGGTNPKGVFGLALDGPMRRVVYP